MGTVEQKILEELSRYNKINKYIQEQDIAAGAVPTPGDEEVPATGDVPPVLPGGETPETGAPTLPTDEPKTPEVVDTEKDPDVEKIGDEGKSEEGGDTEELDITDLVSSQKDIGQKQEDYFNQLFSHLETLESKLGEMDKLMDKVNSLEEKIEKYRPKTAQEKLELRSLDSGPYNQKLTDFFVDKEMDMEKSGKNEYVLTSDEVEDFSPSEIKKTFLPDEDENIKNLGL